MKAFICGASLFFLLYSASWVSMPTHHAFTSWKEYSYYFKKTLYHGVSCVEVLPNGKMFFIDKKGRRCRL